MPYPAPYIAFAFVQKGIDDGRFVTQMKLQKLVYFAHGYHLAKYGTPLINETFQAWKFGPVVPSIYQYFKMYGSKPIIDTHSLQTVPDFLNYELDAQAKDAINYTWSILKDFSAMSLSYWTHHPQTPWSDVYKENEKATPIENLNLQIYFEQLLTSQK